MASLLFLGRESFWLDEAYSVFVARLPADDFWRLISTSEMNSSLYFLLLRGWIALGTEEAVVRLLSVLAALASIPFMHAVARRLLRPPFALVATGLLAVNALFILLAQEARGYSLALFLVLLGSYLFVRAATEGRRWLWVGYVLATGLAPYAHFFAGFVVIAHLVSLLFLDRRPSLKTVLAVYGGLAVMAAPLGLFLLTTSGTQISWIPPLSIRRVGETAAKLAGGRSLVAGALLVLGYAVLSFPALRGLMTERPRRSPRSWRLGLAVAWLAVPVLGAVAVSVVKPLLVDRYLIVALPGLVLTAAMGLERWGRRAGIVALGLLVAVSLSQVVMLHLVPAKDDWRSATGHVLSGARPGDGIAFYRPFGRHPFGYYLERMDGAEVPEPILEVFDWKGDRLRPGPREFADQAIVSAAEPFRRLWVVFNPADADHERRLGRALAEGFVRVERITFRDIIVDLYVAR